MHAPASQLKHSATSEEIKAVAVACGGLRKAARSLGIKEDLVRQRCRRERWMADPVFAEALRNGRTQRGVSPAVTTNVSPAHAIANELAQLNGDSRIRFARGLNQAARHVEVLPGKEVLAQAQEVKAVVGATSTVHGWQNQSPHKVSLRLDVIAAAAEVITLDAEWGESDALAVPAVTRQNGAVV
jgi:hypothetical protein